MPTHSKSKSNRDISSRLRLRAQLAGQRTFDALIPCPHGHTTKYASNGKCVECHIAVVKASQLKRKAQC